MKRTVKIGVLIACVLAALLAGWFARPHLASMSAFQEGIVYASWWHGEYASAESDQTLSEAIKATGANWISVVVTCYQENISSTRIQCKPESKTPTDADLAHVIGDAHRLGFRVMLKPHIDLDGDSTHWRGEIGSGSDEAAWAEWFGSYRDFITHYARVAEENGADYFVVGTELVNTTPRSEDWRKIVKAVRQIYHGPLTYAAHFIYGETIAWWDALDAIGIDAYYSLSSTDVPSPAQMRSAWQPVVIRLGALSKKWDRPVILTEIGYESLNGTSRTPWQASSREADYREQADCYQAAFEAFSGREWLHGMFWWVWTVKTASVSALNHDFSAHNKPAGHVLKLNYGGKLRPLLPAHSTVKYRANDAIVFRDSLEKGWQDWSWDAKPSIARSNADNVGLRVEAAKQGALSLHHDGFDTASYRWLEFYIYVGKNTDPQFTISFNDGSDHEIPQKIDLPNAEYLEGGKFMVNQWQKIRVPLAQMGAENITITRLNIQNRSRQEQTVFFDEIGFIGAD